jgi:hypothetical protein
MLAFGSGDTISKFWAFQESAKSVFEKLARTIDGLVWIDKDGRLRCEDYNSKQYWTAPETWFSNDMQSIRYTSSLKGIYNSINMQGYYGTVWDNIIVNIPLRQTLANGASLTFNVNWEDNREPNNAFAVCYVSEADRTPVYYNFTVTWANTKSRSCDVTITNNTGASIWIDYAWLQLQENIAPISTYNEQDATSISLYQKRQKTIDGYYHSDPDSVCALYLAELKDPKLEIEMTVVNQNAETLAKILRAEVTHLTGVTNNPLQIYAHFRIMHMTHEISMGARRHQVTFRLEHYQDLEYPFEW